MKILSKKKLIKIFIIISIIFLIIMILKPVSFASNASGTTKWGGKLLEPIMDFILAIGDGIIDIIQNSIMGGTNSTIAIDKAKDWIFVIVAILISVAAIAVFIFLTGGIGAAAAAIGKAITAAAAHASGVGALFINGLLASGGTALAAAKGAVLIATVVGAITTTNTAFVFLDDTLFPEITVLPLFSISPEEIFKGDILLFDVNFFNPKKVNKGVIETTQVAEDGTTIETSKEGYYYINSKGEKVVTSQQNSADELKGVISRWYYTLRNLAIVGLMLVLIYVGIRILLSSVASEKSKYKQMFFDWLVAFCLVFVIHYIMIFAVQLTESFTDMIKSSVESTAYMGRIENIDLGTMDKYKKAINNAGMNADDFIKEGILYWPTNLLGFARLQSQRMDGTATYIGYVLCYLILVMYTVFFTFTYAKRLLYIAFLTVIAPLVVLTYPIDKISDGKSQAFDMWLKEYIFNLLLQPLHLLLYTVFISMAFDLAGQNIIYSLVVIGFMIPAEKLLREMFNFKKAHTPGFLSGATGAALVMSGLNTLSKLGSSKKVENKNKENNKINYNDSRGADSGNNFDNVMAGYRSNTDNPGNSSTPTNPDASPLRDDNAPPEESTTPLLDDESNPTDNSENPVTSPLLDGEDLPDEDPSDLLDDEDSAEGERQTEDEEPLENNRKNRIRNMILTRGKVAGKMALKSVPTTLKTGAKLLGGITGATIGLAAGIATGDLGNVVKYTTGGAIAGKAIGTVPSTVIDKGKMALDKSKELDEAYKKELYGSQYKKHRREELDNQFKNNSEVRKEYADKLGIDERFNKELEQAKLIKDKDRRKEEIKRIREEKRKAIDRTMDKAVEFRKYNVTDNDTIIKAMKLGGEDEILRSKHVSKDRIAAAMIATKAKSSKDVAEYRNRLIKQGVSERDADRIVKDARTINDDI